MSDNTKALRCADALDALRSDNTAEALADQAAAELRRLHALNAELVEALRCCRDMVGHPDNVALIDAAMAKVEASNEP